MKKARPNLSASLRRRRALRVAVGVRRFRFRPLDVGSGRQFGDVPKIANSLQGALQLCHTWLRLNRPSSSSWWFFIEELAFDESERFSVVVSAQDVLVYALTLWDGYRPSFQCRDRREAIHAG